MEEVKTGNIYKAIPAIMAEIKSIGKDRKNAQQGYAYRGIDDLYNACQPLMVKYKVFTVPKIIDQKREERESRNGGLLIYTIFTIEYTFFADDGSFVTATVVGEGMDSGDKSSNKAMAVAHKYALVQMFSAPTAEMLDPEIDSPDPKPKKKADPKTEEQLDPELRTDGDSDLKTFPDEHIPTCPSCNGTSTMRSKYPKNGAWYCKECKIAFDEAPPVQQDIF